MSISQLLLKMIAPIKSRLGRSKNNAVTRAVLRRVWSRGAVPKAGMLECDTWRQIHIPNSVSTTYMSDQSGKIEYRLNNAGYRGELPDPAAELRVCLIGESVGFGEGIEYEKALAQRLKHLLSQATDIPPSKVNVVNLSIGGASADHCVRSLIRQYEYIVPHVTLFVVPAPDRIEYNDQTGNVNYAFSNFDLERLEEAPVSAQGFCDLYNPIAGCVNWAKNILLFQFFCESRACEHLAISPSQNWIAAQRPAVQDYMKQIDQDRFLEISVKSFQPDVAADERHIGPQTHLMLAMAIIDRLSNLIGQHSQFPKSGKLTEFVTEQRLHNEEWKSVTDKWLK